MKQGCCRCQSAVTRTISIVRFWQEIDWETYQAINVHDSNLRTREALGDLCQIRRLVLEDRIDQRHVLEHLLADLGDVARLVFPVLRSRQSAFAGQAVLRRQIQRCDVLQDEVTAAVVVDALNGVEDAVGVVDDSGACDLRVGDEGVIAEIVGADEDAVDGLVWWVDHEFRAVLVDVVRVCDVGRDLILLNSREGSVNGGECARSDVVAAHGTGDGVVVDICT